MAFCGQTRQWQKQTAQTVGAQHRTSHGLDIENINGIRRSGLRPVLGSMNEAACRQEEEHDQRSTSRKVSRREESGREESEEGIIVHVTTIR